MSDPDFWIVFGGLFVCWFLILNGQELIAVMLRRGKKP